MARQFQMRQWMRMSRYAAVIRTLRRSVSSVLRSYPVVRIDDVREEVSLEHVRGGERETAVVHRFENRVGIAV